MPTLAGARARPIQNVELAFSGTVERGPSRGTTLAGPLLLKITGERFTGLLKIADGTTGAAPLADRTSSSVSRPLTRGQVRLRALQSLAF